MRCYNLFWLLGGARDNNLFCTLEEIPRHVLHHRIPRNLTKAEIPWLFMELILRFLTSKYLTNMSKRLTALYSPGSISIIPCQHDVLWKGKRIRFLWTELLHRIGELIHPMVGCLRARGKRYNWKRENWDIKLENVNTNWVGKTRLKHQRERKWELRETERSLRECWFMKVRKNISWKVWGSTLVPEVEGEC